MPNLVQFTLPVVEDVRSEIQMVEREYYKDNTKKSFSYSNPNLCPSSNINGKEGLVLSPVVCFCSCLSFLLFVCYIPLHLLNYIGNTRVHPCRIRFWLLLLLSRPSARLMLLRNLSHTDTYLIVSWLPPWNFKCYFVPCYQNSWSIIWKWS